MEPGRIAAIMMLVALTPAAGQSQEPHTPPPAPALESVEPGSVIRVLTARGRLQGHLLRLDSNRVWIKPGFDIRLARTPDTTWVEPLAEVRLAWVRTGTKAWTGVKLGALIGGAAGLVAGCFLGAAIGDESVPCHPEALAWAIPRGLAAGVVAGGVTGYFLKVWVPLRL